MYAKASVLVALLASSIACERKAPGPSECQAFAEIVMSVTEEAYAPRAVRRAKYDEHVRRCLTTPYDDEFVACVVQTQRYRPCRVEFELRKQLED